ncbi:MAG TPA: hypothetical protein DEA47_01015 [Peptococcaceae bacterium]|nr:hypothetical protein [Peptococcaceae bacterium]
MKALKKASTYKAVDDDDKRNAKKIIDLINKRRVYYMKGISGRIFKFECVVSSHFNPLFFYLFTTGKEFLPIEVADRFAKQLLSVLEVKLPLQEEYR